MSIPGARVVPFLSALAAAAALAWAGVAAAHHGWSGYGERAERFTGAVRAVSYGSPHVIIELEVKERAEERVKERIWRVVLAPPSRLERRGLAKEALVAGETATVEAYRHLREKDELRAEWIELGGKRVELR